MVEITLGLGLGILELPLELLVLLCDLVGLGLHVADLFHLLLKRVLELNPLILKVGFLLLKSCLSLLKIPKQGGFVIIQCLDLRLEVTNFTL